MFVMFYRKYRPQKFADISKPNEVAEALMNQIKNKKPAQAYVFSGPRGTGKTTTARVLSKALNCEHLDKDGDVCDKCASCEAIKNGNFLDLIEIDAASNRGIDDIRDLRDKIKLAPSVGKRKVYIIDEVHMLTTEAFNALLKTLEEPPRHATFILCTTELHKVPDTIKSRCQVFKFKRATVPQITIRLEKICKEENCELSKDDLRKIAVASSGGFRDADTLLQQVIEGNVSVDSLTGMGNVGDYTIFVDYLVEKDAYRAIKFVNDTYQEGRDLYVWTLDLLNYLRNLLFISSGANEGVVDVSDEVLELMKRQSNKISSQNVVLYLEKFLKAGNLIKSSAIPQLPLEICIVEVCGDSNSGSNWPVEPKPDKGVFNKGSTANVKGKTDEGKSLKTDTVDKSVRELKSKEKTIENEEFSTSKIILEKTQIEEKWQELLSLISKENGSVQALMKSGKIQKVEGSSIIFEVYYSFHKERLDSPKNKKIVEQAFYEVYGYKLNVKCVMSAEKPPKKSLSPKESGILTDYNVSSPVSLDSATIKGSVLDIFDGGLPL